MPRALVLATLLLGAACAAVRPAAPLQPAATAVFTEVLAPLDHPFVALRCLDEQRHLAVVEISSSPPAQVRSDGTRLAPGPSSWAMETIDLGASPARLAQRWEATESNAQCLARAGGTFCQPFPGLPVSGTPEADFVRREQLLGSCDGVHQRPEASSDGARVLLRADRGELEPIFLTVRSQLDPKLASGKVEHAYKPVFAPDGQRYAFTGYQAGHYWPFVGRLDLTVRRLALQDAVEGAAFSADGRWLFALAESAVKGEICLHRLAVEGGDDLTLSCLPGDANSVRFELDERTGTALLLATGERTTRMRWLASDRPEKVLAERSYRELPLLEAAQATLRSDGTLLVAGLVDTPEVISLATGARRPALPPSGPAGCWVSYSDPSWDRREPAVVLAQRSCGERTTIELWKIDVDRVLAGPELGR